MYPMLVVWEDGQHGVYTVTEVGWSVDTQCTCNGLLIEDCYYLPTWVLLQVYTRVTPVTLHLISGLNRTSCSHVACNISPEGQKHCDL